MATVSSVLPESTTIRSSAQATDSSASSDVRGFVAGDDGDRDRRHGGTVAESLPGCGVQVAVGSGQWEWRGSEAAVEPTHCPQPPVRSYGPVVVPLAPPEITLLVAPPSVVGCEPANDVAPLVGATWTVSKLTCEMS